MYIHSVYKKTTAFCTEHLMALMAAKELRIGRTGLSMNPRYQLGAYLSKVSKVRKEELMKIASVEI